MNVLPQDKERALQIYRCCSLYLDRARFELQCYNFDAAEYWVREFEKCKRDLDELIKQKEEHDKLIQVVELVKEKGIDIAIIMREGNEQ
jgi:hypothetical protein